MSVHTHDGHLALGGDNVRHGTWKFTGPFGLGDLENDSLKRLDREFRRELQDIEDGLTPPHMRAERKRYCERALEDIETEVALRVMLQRRYGAHPHGTDNVSDYWLVAPAPAPSYWLALVLDYEQYRQGEESVLGWASLEASHSRATVMRALSLEGALVLEQAMERAA